MIPESPDTEEEDIDDEEPDEEEYEDEAWKKKRNFVNITVAGGGNINNVELHARVFVDFSEKRVAQTQLADAIDVLHRAIPVTSLASMDREYFESLPQGALDAQGNFQPLNSDVKNALKTQEALKKQQERKDRHDESK